MRSYDDALTLLMELRDDVIDLEEKRQRNLRSGLNAADKSERDRGIAQDIERTKERGIQVLKDLVRYPPFHQTYAQPFAEFAKNYACDKAVFIMTKYPDGTDKAKDAELQRVIDATKASVASCRFIPCVASDRKFHPQLWNNVEVYLLACARGIAIVENRYRPELNPNVAMEWGWMRAMGKPVLYLIENDVKVEPADVSGLIKDRFPWDDPEKAIAAVVSKELNGGPSVP